MPLGNALDVPQPLGLVDALKLFNRKERNWVFRDLMGTAAEQISDDFRKRVEETVCRKDEDFVLGANPYWATDYHLNWLIAVLHMLKFGLENVAQPQRNAVELIKDNQEDIDLVLATDDTLLLIEAKGEGAWTNKQLTSKMERLRSLTPTLIDDQGCVESRAGSINVRLLLCAPREPPKPNRLHATNWPAWTRATDGRPLHFHLRPPSTHFMRTERCDSAGKAAAKGGFWHVVNTTKEKPAP